MTCPKCNAELSGDQCSHCAESGSLKQAEVNEAGGSATTEEGGAQPEDMKRAPNEPSKEPESAGETGDSTPAGAAAANQSTTESTGAKKGQEGARPPIVPPSVNVKESELRDFFMATGIGNTNIGRLVTKLQPSDRPPTLFDYMEELPPPKTTGTATFDDSELEDASSALDAKRILLLVCSDRDVARTAGDALLTRATTTTRRILSFNGLPAELSFDIHGLTMRAARKNEMLLVVDAFEGDRARKFIDSLFAEGAYGTDRICLGLQRVRLRIACITSEESVADRMSRLEYEHWLVSSARILLRKEFPDDFQSVEARINEQRRAGNWSRSAIEFRKQLEELVRTGELRAVVEKGGPLAETAIVKPEEQSPIADPDNLLSVAVLYAATFYPNLSATEFIEIVKLLVGDQRTLVPESVQQKTKDGSFKMVELKREKPIADIWTAKTDTVLRENRLITSRDVGRPVTFADVGRRDLLRRHFEEQFGAYVLQQFVMAWDKGLLYERSTRVASAVITLTVEMALTDPDQFDREWVTERILHFCEQSSVSSFILLRSADLLRAMLRQPPLDAVVNGVVQRLLQLGRHDYALTIIKALRLAPEFDDLYWLQQVLDRGTNEIREEASIYLFNELRRADIGIERFVTTLANKWLPAADRDPASYSHANGAALVTVFAFCFEVTEGFDANLYGSWPSRFPIIASDPQSAAKQFGAVLRCLFHPGLISALEGDLVPENLTRELALLVSRWVFILFGYSEEKPDAEDEGGDFTRNQALSVLVAQLLAVTAGATGRATRALLLDEWEWAKEIYVHAPWLYGEEGHQRRREFGRKRRLVHDLITEFRRQQRAEQKTPTTNHATA